MSYAYYNENDPFAAAWLRELIKDGLIAPGVVDERSISDVVPNDLKGFTQCHFFAGIGVWSLALRLAGWPDDRPIWTGSCPCQPFSNAGEGEGFDDERHLWPSWYHHIVTVKARNVPVVGEQVASKEGRAWFDLVQADMEGLEHACGVVDTCAAGFGAPLIGQRLYWLAATDDARLQGRSSEQRTGGSNQCVVGENRVVDSMAATTGAAIDAGIYRPIDRIPLHPTNYWDHAEWLACRGTEGVRFRPVKPGTFPLVDAWSVVNRMDVVRGAGNALNVSQATCFIEAVMEYLAL